MLAASFEKKDIQAIRSAIQRNPETVLNETGKFLARGIAVYNRGIIRSPWRVGMTGGGSPVATGNLRDTHGKTVSQWSASVSPNAEYAKYVHKDRPWLDHVFSTSGREIDKLQTDLLETITKDLAR
jgi:hypothetical protein